MRASERASERGAPGPARGLRAPGRGEGACARGAGESAAARIRAGCAPRAEVPSKSVLIKAWNTENIKELQLKSYSFPSFPRPATLLPLPQAALSWRALRRPSPECRELSSVIFDCCLSLNVQLVKLKSLSLRRKKKKKSPSLPSRAPERLCMALALLTTLPSRMSLRSLKWSLLLLSVLSFLVMWYLSLPHYNVIERVNWMYFYEYEPIYRQDFRFTLREHSNCSHQNPFLVILVTSHPSDVKARQAIRVTWGEKKSWWGYEVLTFFLLGQQGEREDKVLALSLEDEHLLYGDIIRQDFLDTYNNLTLKTIMAFRWVTEFCPNAKYIMKTDTDVFINTGNLVKYLLNLNHSEKFFTGYPLIDNYSYRGFYQKTHISYQEYPFKVFPPYCSGLGYIMSRDLVPKIYEMMSHVKPIKFEDVYVGICLNLLKVDIHIPEDTNLFFLYRIHLDVCQLRRVIAAHGFSSKEIITFWQVMLRNTTCHY
ncbi:PREDICTED: UDP-GalNAc:beta-1,3-N-acetylgalactosaminyltransferase 1 isoform X2 [Hipposideros armiger]|uniref:Hexosyltransferase n=1 Tax=Hipposideros armiger TaxID=186990 RepID=A0A8B7Q1U1_HIPAR|nr:PREDICTED: UDP-GalNAc:beta-1,3-N-acetylgalactosaminyltransferase 1 isoform X2 [Hipposideros armiger]